MTSKKSLGSRSKKKTTVENDGFLRLAVPDTLQVPTDPLRFRIDVHNQSVVLREFDGDVSSVKWVDAMDLAIAVARQLPSGTGLLPKNTLWWKNTSEGPIYALWEEPKVWKLALQEMALKTPRRFECPMPGLIFLCMPGKTPWVFAAKRRPTKESDIVYSAPLCNIFASGRVCAGSHKFPMTVGNIPDSFFRSFFSPTADLSNRSVMFPENVVHLWEYLDKKKKYPLNDLVKMGTLKDLINLDVSERW